MWLDEFKWDFSGIQKAVCVVLQLALSMLIAKNDMIYHFILIEKFGGVYRFFYVKDGCFVLGYYARLTC